MLFIVSFIFEMISLKGFPSPRTFFKVFSKPPGVERQLPAEATGLFPGDKEAERRETAFQAEGRQFLLGCNFDHYKEECKSKQHLIPTTCWTLFRTASWLFHTFFRGGGWTFFWNGAHSERNGPVTSAKFLNMTCPPPWIGFRKSQGDHAQAHLSWSVLSNKMDRQ